LIYRRMFLHYFYEIRKCVIMMNVLIFAFLVVGAVTSQSIDSFNDITNGIKNGNIDAQHVKHIKDIRITPEIVEEPEVNVTEIFIANPCLVRTCFKGSMCIITSKNVSLPLEKRTQCACPTYCNDKYKPVCSVYGETFENVCELHIKACKIGENIQIAYEGECIVEAGACSKEEFSQFAPRFIDWMYMVRNEYVYGEANQNNDINQLPHADKVHVAQWMYEHIDENRNNILDSSEIGSLLMYLISVESCVTEFIAKCDTNTNGSINFKEWKTCLLPGSNSVEDNFFFNDV